MNGWSGMGMRDKMNAGEVCPPVYLMSDINAGPADVLPLPPVPLG
jgi:hypothetical protein